MALTLPTGRQAGTWLTILVGLLGIVTGIVHISYSPVLTVLEPYIPPIVRSAIGFTSTITGFVLLAAGYGLGQGYRSAWYIAVILLPLAAAQGLIQASPLAIPLVVGALLAEAIILLHRRRFPNPSGLSSVQLAAASAVVGVQVYGTVGGYTLRDEFTGIDTVLDAFYFTLVTASTVGYGDITATTQSARLFAMSVLIFGTASFGAAIGVLLGPLIEARLAAGLGRIQNRQLRNLHDHVILLGTGELTQPMISELEDNAEFVVVTRDPALADELTTRGVLAVTGDPSDEATLERVNIDQAQAVIAATSTDADDVLGALTANSLAPGIRIVAAATNAENVSKLRRAGADVVLDPSYIGAQLLIDSIDS